MGRIKVTTYPDDFKRVCVDCKQPLYLLYSSPLKSPQSMWKLTDKAKEWLEKYTESGKMYDEEEGANNSINDSLAEFLLAVQDLDILDVNTLPKEFYPEFEEAKKRGFFDFGGGSYKAGRYHIECINKKCPGKYAMRGHNPSARDPRGMMVNINEDGSQDRLQVVEANNIPKTEGLCPFDGAAVIENPSGLVCTDCGRTFRKDRNGVLKNELNRQL